MKRFSMLSLLLISLLFIPNIVNAAYYENDYGLELTQQEYTNLRKLYTDKFISTMNEEEYQKVANLDFDAIQKQTKYIRSDYNLITGETTETEMSESEYDAVGSERIELLRSTYIETTYKQLILSLARNDSTSAYASVTTIWKVMPATTSFDVIGMRLVNFSYINGSQGGRQVYTPSGGTTNYIYYAPDGTNINNQNNGFGISMNLVNQNLSYLECNIDASLTTNAYPAAVYGSYQHATSNVTLAISKSYTLSSGGMGNVFVFSGSYGNYYDGMAGIYTGLSS